MSSNEWKEVCFEDVMSMPLRNGLSKPKAIRGSGIKMVNMGEIFQFDRIFDEFEMDKVPTTEKEFTNTKLKEGDLLFARQSLVWDGAGKCSIVMQAKEDLVYESHIIRVRLNQTEVNPMFYYYYFKSPVGKGRIMSIVEQVAAAGIRGSDLKKIKVPKPSLPEQKSIAKLLSCLDDKIELNNRINKTLEEMAQAIFKSWFVDFEPFQDGEFEDSQLGRIPKGWRVGTIEEIAEICIGGDWGKERQERGLKPVICLRGTDLQFLKEFGYSSNAPIRWVKPDSIIKREITNRDILVGGSGLGPIGRSLYCSDSLKNLYDYSLLYSNFCKKIRARDLQTAVYLESVIENLYVQGALKSYMNGTSIPNLDVNSLMRRELLIPSDEVIMSYAKLKQLYFQRQFSTENQKLSTIRDTLLPKLMSGEIRVPIEEVQ